MVPARNKAKRLASSLYRDPLILLTLKKTRMIGSFFTIDLQIFNSLGQCNAFSLSFK